MPDINPADLSRPAAGLATPVLPSKALALAATKTVKTSQIPPRIDLEGPYTALKNAMDFEQWKSYKTAVTQFLVGRLSQAEFAHVIDPILATPGGGGERERLHNQLLAAIYGNVTREIPDPGLAPWVSANDKPTPGLSSKPNTNDAHERRIKGEVMMLPSKDRRRIKDVALNKPFDPYDELSRVFADQRPKAPRPTDTQPTSATGGLNRMNLDLEIRKRYAQPLAVESGEFPDTGNIEARMLPICYEAGLSAGHAPDAASYVSLATETFVKEFLTAVFSRTRSNGPGEFGSAGFGGNDWVQTHAYRRQLAREEERASRGEIHRDKMGLLPVEARKAGERGPLGLAECRIALEMGDCGLAHFPIVGHTLMASYREGELEGYDDHAWIGEGGALTTEALELLPSQGATSANAPPDVASAVAVGAAVPGGVAMKASASAAGQPLHALANGATATGVNGANGVTGANGAMHADAMDLDPDPDDVPWEGADGSDMDTLGSVLDSCLAVG